jgi:hypothetical protein
MQSNLGANNNLMRNSNSDIRSVNGELDKKYNQGLDWFLNSEYYTANIPVTFLYLNEANHLETTGQPWQEGRTVSFSKQYVSGDKVIIYYANEVASNNEQSLIQNFLKKHNVPLKDVILVGNLFEYEGRQTKVGLDLGLAPSQMLMIDYYELQTFFFHKVLGCDYNKSFNPYAAKDIKYLFGKIDKPVRIITMYKLWEQGLLGNAVTGCLVDGSDIDSLAKQISEEFSKWCKQDVPYESISQMLKTHHGSPDNVSYYYFTLSDAIKQNAECLFDKINHCPSYPYDHQILFTESKVSLIPETFYYTRQAHFLTEKTYKTIYNHHPFTILGTAGLLETLRSKGYKTFNGICDEMYDLCPNDRKRVDLVINATRELLNSPNLEEIDTITKHNFAQLEKNSLATVDQLNAIILDNFS